MRFYQPRFFKPQELLPRDVFARFGASGLIVFDPRILFTLDKIREFFGKPITVNNWHLGGQFSQRGFRNDIETGAGLSQHRFGRAVDFDIAGISADEFRGLITAGRLNDVLTEASRCEQGVNWVHLDCASSREMGIVFFHS